MRGSFAKFSAGLVACVVVGSTASVVLAAPASATPTCTSACYVDATLGLDTNPGTSASPLRTIQAGINAVASPGTVYVRTGSYNETAAGSMTTSLGFPAGGYTFGLYLGKSQITVQGVHADNTPITTRGDPGMPTVTTNATNDFGYDGVFVEGDGDTISGLDIGQNLPADPTCINTNKTIEDVGDAFTFSYGEINDPCGGDIYIDDFRYTAGTNTPHVNSYTITGSLFGACNTIDIAVRGRRRHTRLEPRNHEQRVPGRFISPVRGLRWRDGPQRRSLLAGDQLRRCR